MHNRKMKFHRNHSKRNGIIYDNDMAAIVKRTIAQPVGIKLPWNPKYITPCAPEKKCTTCSDPVQAMQWDKWYEEHGFKFDVPGWAQDYATIPSYHPNDPNTGRRWWRHCKCQRYSVMMAAWWEGILPENT